MEKPTDSDRIHQLLMGLMDGELNDEETYEIREKLSRSADLREEFERLNSANDQLKLLSEAEIDEALLRKVWKNPFRKTLRRGSYALIGLGTIGIMAIGAIRYVQKGHPDLFITACIGGIGIGLILLFLQVIRDRMITHKNDPYKDIEF